jgi:aminoglycoside 6'-N-acetyltransferase
MNSSSYSFRPVTSDDLPLLKRWLQTPEVTRWWGDPAVEAALIEEDLAVPEMAQWVVSLVDRPFAYAQAYEVHAWPQAHLSHLPPGTMAIDAFIGEHDMIGQGHGGRFLRLLAEQLIESGAPVIAIDPDINNLRAQRAYYRAGFRGDMAVETLHGFVLPMTFSRQSSEVDSL